MTKDTKVTTLNMTESFNEVNNASSAELIDIVEELTVEENFDVEIGDAMELDGFSFNL